MNSRGGPAIKVVSDGRGLDELHDEWNALLAQSASDRVFMTHEWFSCWWRAFGEGKDLSIVLVFENGELCGIAPLMACRGRFRGFPVTTVQFMANDDSPRCGFIIKRGREHLVEEIVGFLSRGLGGWSMVSLKNVPREGRANEEIERCLPGVPGRWIVRDGLRSPYLRLDPPWESYFKGLSPVRRKSLRRLCNKVKREGSITIREHRDAGCLGEVARISTNGWKHRERKSFVNRPDRESFFRSLSRVAEEKGWLSVWCMYCGDEPIAYEYHLKYGGVDTALLADFDSRYEGMSPGTYLDYMIVKSLFAGSLSEYDMCGSQDEYKTKWSKETREHEHIRIFNTSLYSRFLCFLEKGPVAALRRLRDRMRDA